MILAAGGLGLIVLSHPSDLTSLPLWRPTLLAIVLLSGSTALARHPSLAAQDLLGLAFGFVIFYVARSALSTTQSIRTFVLIGASSTIPLLLIAAIQQISFVQGHPTPWSFALGRWEVPATLFNSSVLACYTAIWFFPLMHPSIPRSLRWALWGVGIALGLLSRSVWGLFVIGALWSYPKLKASPLRMGLVFLFALAALFAFKFIQPLDGHSYQTSGRLYFWQTAIEMFKSQPFTGIGLGGYGEAFPFFDRGLSLENTRYSHSLVFKLLAESGMLGLLAFVIWGVRYWRLPTSDVHDGTWVPLFNKSLGVLLLFSLITITSEILLIQWLTFILLAARVSVKWGLDNVAIDPSWVNRLIIQGILIIGMAGILSLWLSSMMVHRARSLLPVSIERAETYFDRALRINPYSADAHLGLAVVSEQTNSSDLNSKAQRSAQFHLQRAGRLNRNLMMVIQGNHADPLPSTLDRPR